MIRLGEYYVEEEEIVGITKIMKTDAGGKYCKFNIHLFGGSKMEIFDSKNELGRPVSAYELRSKLLKIIGEKDD